MIQWNNPIIFFHQSISIYISCDLFAKKKKKKKKDVEQIRIHIDAKRVVYRVGGR